MHRSAPQEGHIDRATALVRHGGNIFHHVRGEDVVRFLRIIRSDAEARVKLLVIHGDIAFQASAVSLVCSEIYTSPASSLPKSQVSHCPLNTVFLVFSVRNLFPKCLQFKWHNDGLQQFRRRQALNISNCRPCKKVGLYRVPLRRQDGLSCIRRRRHRKTEENPLKAESSVKRCSWQDEAILLSACFRQTPERFP